MIEKGMYFGCDTIYELIRNVGGQWNDAKERPLVCLIKSVEHKDLYWAIPVGALDHRDEKAKKRIEGFMNNDSRNLSSCFYHIGKTTRHSIFFISDVIPITDKYIMREYLGHDKNQYVIKNNKLIKELERKLRRILAYEKDNPNYFRQHITDVKNHLLNELDSK